VLVSLNSALNEFFLMSGAENDQLFPEEILEEGRKYLEANSVEHEIRMYAGVPHGKIQCL
jgi:Dienelactone hydrolase family